MSPEVPAAGLDQYADRLRTIAYRLVGSAHDAEDAVQQTFLKATQLGPDDVDNLPAWLTTVTARHCLDLLRARRRRREVALPADDGADPAPAATVTRSAEDEAVLVESVGLALLVVLDRLSPAQRVAFVLHDLFAVPFDDVGRALDRSPVAAKKLASRARDRVRGVGDDPAGRRLAAEHRPLVEAFLAASRGGDVAALLDLLAPGVVRRVDRILVPAHIATELEGAREVAEETRTFAARARAGAVATVDGAPGIVIAPHGRLEAVIRLTIDGGRIRTVDVVGDPARLAAVTITLP